MIDKNNIIPALILFMLPGLFSTLYAQDQRLEPFQENGRWGYADSSGKLVIGARYLLAMTFTSKGLAAVVDDSGWIYINRQGEKLVRPFIFDNGPDYFSEGLARYVDNGKMGFFNESGEIIIRAIFSFVSPFREGLAAFCTGCQRKASGEHYSYQGGKWGYIDKQGKVIIKAVFDQASPFEEGVAAVSAAGHRYLINKQGKIIH